MSLQVQPPVLGQVSLSAHFRESIAFFVSDLGNHSNRIISLRHARPPDLIRGLSRASTSFLPRAIKQNVDGRDEPGNDSEEMVRHDRNARLIAGRGLLGLRIPECLMAALADILHSPANVLQQRDVFGLASLQRF